MIIIILKRLRVFLQVVLLRKYFIFIFKIFLIIFKYFFKIFLIILIFRFWVNNNFIKSDDDKIKSYNNCTVIPNEKYCVLHNARCVFSGTRCSEREDFQDNIKILFDDFCEFSKKLNHPELCYLNCHKNGGLCVKNEEINM